MDGRGEQPVLDERFELRTPIGAGGMSEVYRAFDRVRGEEVALKVLPALDPTALMRFKSEFRALHDLQHPNIVALHELHEDRGTWFFTMQLVQGVDVLTWVGTDETRLRAVLPQIARALVRLHDGGLVHRDVKPSNILVTRDGKATLLDFGLVAPAWSPGEGAGTPSFMAPEQVEGHITPASDWYAFGVLIFRALTQQMPFTGSIEDVLRAKTSRAAPRVRSVRASAPVDLAELADALLARAPRERPHADAVLAALGTGREASELVRPILVGRDRELAELQQAFDERMQGAALAIAVAGESGIGKTSLLRTFAEDIEQAGKARVLRGRCWERESVPYKGFDGVVDDLTAIVESDGIDLEPGGWEAILVQAFPVLRRLPAFAQTRLSQDVGGRETAARVSGGIRWLLSEVARHEPLVVVIDDLQWADRDALALLRGVLEPPLTNVLVVVGAREPIDLDSRAVLQTIQLRPLSADDTTSLVKALARELGSAIDPAAIAQEAAGHPLFASELTRHAAVTGEIGAITFDEAVRRITERLGGDARRLARIIGLAHAPISAVDAARAAGQSPATLFETVASLRAAQVVATVGLGTTMKLEPYHDRIRRVLAADVTAEGRRELHEAIAAALEHGGAADPEVLALHWADAGATAKAARHALRAAEQAEAALAFHRAARLYNWVAELDRGIPHVRVRHAECLAQAGLGVLAADAYLACARDATGTDALDLRRRAMQQLLLMGYNARALELYDELARELDLPNPKRKGQMIAGLLARRAALRLRRGELPDRTTMDPLDRVRLDVLWDAAAGISQFDPLRAFYLHSVQIVRSLAVGDNSRITRALLGEVPYIATSGRASRRLDEMLERADRAADRAAFPALKHLAHGCVGFCFGRWRECRQHLDETERLLLQERPRLVAEGAGPAQLLDLTRRFQLVSLLYLGDLHGIDRRMPELLLDARERNDISATTYLRTGVQAVVHLAFDRVAVAEIDAEEAFRPWQDGHVGVPHFMDIQARTSIALYIGRADAAYRAVTEQWSVLWRARLLSVQYLHVTMLDSRGRSAIAAALAASGSARERLLQDATRCASALTETGALWAAPLADAIRAGVAACRGDREHAVASLDRAERGFSTAEMALHLANARLVRAELAGTAEAVQASRGALAAAGVADVDRFSAFLLPRTRR